MVKLSAFHLSLKSARAALPTDPANRFAVLAEQASLQVEWRTASLILTTR